MKNNQNFDSGDEKPKFSDLFTYINILGNGSFGTVVSARYKSTNELCAVKIVNKNPIQNSYVDSLRNEAYIISQLNHPNIVKFIDIIETDKRVFLILECLKDGSLKSLIEKRFKDNNIFTDDEVAIIMKSIISAVNYMHLKDIVHRDIKPENILLEDINDLSKVKICDFGLSVQYDNQNLKKSFFDQCGTKLFMAPELCSRKKYSKPVDIWSCGIIMYMLLSQGKHPLYDKDDDSDSYQAKLMNPKWVFHEGFTPMAKNFFLKLVEHDPADRLTAERMLKHPWITRNFNDEIPMTICETMHTFNKEQAFSRIIKAMMFLSSLQQQQNKLIEERFGSAESNSGEDNNTYERNSSGLTDTTASKTYERTSSYEKKNSDSSMISSYNNDKIQIKANFTFQLNPVEYNYDIPEIKLDQIGITEEVVEENILQELTSEEAENRQLYDSSLNNTTALIDHTPNQIRKKITKLNNIANNAYQSINYSNRNSVIISSNNTTAIINSNVSMINQKINTEIKYATNIPLLSKRIKVFSKNNWKPPLNITTTKTIFDKNDKASSPNSVRVSGYRSSSSGTNSIGSSILSSPNSISPIKIAQHYNFCHENYISFDTHTKLDKQNKVYCSGGGHTKNNKSSISTLNSYESNSKLPHLKLNSNPERDTYIIKHKQPLKTTYSPIDIRNDIRRSIYKNEPNREYQITGYKKRSHSFRQAALANRVIIDTAHIKDSKMSISPTK